MQSNSVTRQVSFNRTKIGGKCQNSNITFWVIFKQCEPACENKIKIFGVLSFEVQNTILSLCRANENNSDGYVVLKSDTQISQVYPATLEEIVGRQYI